MPFSYDLSISAVQAKSISDLVDDVAGFLVAAKSGKTSLKSSDMVFAVDSAETTIYGDWTEGDTEKVRAKVRDLLGFHEANTNDIEVTVEQNEYTKTIRSYPIHVPGHYGCYKGEECWAKRDAVGLLVKRVGGVAGVTSEVQELSQGRSRSGKESENEKTS